MIAYPDCYPCLVRHVAEVLQRAGCRDDQQKKLIRGVLQRMADQPLNATPVRLTAVIHRLIQFELGIEDLYQDLKDKSNRQAMNFLPGLYQILDQADDRLLTAAKFAIAGNIIDYGSTGEGFDLAQTLAECQRSAFGLDDFERLRSELAVAERVVYVGDNAGEIVFDRLFMEEIKKLSNPEIVFVVRGRAILNDVTLADAQTAGIPGVARVVSSGGDGPGCEMALATPAVRRCFETADVIISKGQGNYEALSNAPHNIYFLLKVKCHVIADDIGARKGDSVVKLSDVRRQKTGDR